MPSAKASISGRQRGAGVANAMALRGRVAMRDIDNRESR